MANSMQIDGLTRLRELTFQVDMPEAMVAFGRVCAACFKENDILILTGDLGAGKTQFSKGVAAGLGVNRPVTSPTFNLMYEYPDGRIPFYHWDLYRLENIDDLYNAGVFDYVEADGVCIFEWGEAFASEIGDEYLIIRIERGELLNEEEPSRIVKLDPTGKRAIQLACAIDNLFLDLN